MKNKILSEKYKKLIVYDEKDKTELAVVTNEEISTANGIVVKLTPTDKNFNQNNVKGIGIPIYTPKRECIGHIMVNEELQVESNLQQGYYIGK